MPMTPETRAKFAAFADMMAQRREANAQRDDQLAKLKTQRKDAKLALRQTDDSEILRKIRALQNAQRNAWRPVMNVLIGQHQTCECCGHEAIATTGMFAREINTLVQGATRLIEVDTFHPLLETETQLSGVALRGCVLCKGGTSIGEHDALIDIILSNPPRIESQLQLQLPEPTQQ